MVHMFIIFIIGGLLRTWLIFSKYQPIIGNHIEVSTPLNSWKRVSEGLYLMKNNINPYTGDLLHEPPIILTILKILLQIFPNKEVMFITFDLLTCVTLCFTAKRFLKHLINEEEEKQNEFAVDAKEYLLPKLQLDQAPKYIMMAYLFNPYTLFNCVGCTTTVFHNFFLSLFLSGMVYGNIVIAAFGLAQAMTMSFYPFVLLAPLYLYFNHHYNSKRRAYFSVTLCLVFCLLFVYLSNQNSHGVSYFKNVYGFILTVPDLQPNIGLFWYFFTEMFDHFRDLFIYSFQINATILYLIPLSIKLHKSPFLLTVALIFLISIFKSYPSVGDVGFALSLLPCFIHLGKYCQQGFLVSAILLLTTALAPILWYLWIYCNSANANFYFGVTLGFAIAQIFLSTDLLFAQVKREFCLKHGKERKIDGEDAILILE